MTDYLSRKPFLDLLKSIIANQRDNPSGYSFAIDGEWGCGKTWILNELEEKLSKDTENNYLVFHYNAWENDFYDEPLVAILSVMIECLKNQKTKVKEKDSAKKVITSSITTLTRIAGTVIEKKWQINPNDIVEAVKDSGKAFGDVKLTKSDFNNMLPLENALKQIKEVIKKVTKELHIILVVDELDRCLPEYAIKVLERLHHICNEMPVVQILAINKRHLADSIAKVFGKNYGKAENPTECKNQFAESYLQKFVDLIIPLPNGKVDSRLEVLNGLEKEYKPYIRPDNIGSDFIKVDDEFLASFITALMDGVERRLQEKIFKQVVLCHKLTIQSGVQLNEERMTYAILIYEILSCISRYVFHSNASCEFIQKKSSDLYTLSFNNEIATSGIFESSVFTDFQKNIQEFFYCPIKYYDKPNGRHRLPFEIQETKSYLMAFFTKQEVQSYDPLQNGLWRWIAGYKVFLQKYDEIMDMLVIK